MQTNLQNQQEEYKETELGLLPREWEVVRLGEVATDIKQGKVLATTKIRSFAEYPVYGANGIIGYYGEFFVPENKVLVTCRGSIGNINVTFKKSFVTNNAMILYEKAERIDWRFLKYALIKYDVTNLKTGSVQPQIIKGTLINHKLPLPPLKEQKSIAYVLSTIQTAKEKTEQVIKATKELKKSMMKHLFTYGPVSLEEAEKVKLKETEIGMMPEEWEVKSFGDIGDLQYGYTETASEKEIGPKFLRITDIDLTGGRINWMNVPYCEISDDNYSKYRLHEGDVLIARIGATTGKTCIIKNPPKSVFASYLIRFTVNKDKVDPSFVYYFTTSQKYWDEISASKGGRLKKGVSSSQLQTFKIPLPSLPIQQKIAGILSAIDEKIQLEENKKKALEELFKSMLHNLMTGRLRVNKLNLEVNAWM